jgi:hypothetical protein
VAASNLVFQGHVNYSGGKSGRHPKALASFLSLGNRNIYHRTVVPIAVGDVFFFEASLKTADTAMTKANNAIITAKSIDLGSRPRLSKFLTMDRAPVTDASR